MRRSREYQRCSVNGQSDYLLYGTRAVLRREGSEVTPLCGGRWRPINRARSAVICQPLGQRATLADGGCWIAGRRDGEAEHNAYRRSGVISAGERWCLLNLQREGLARAACKRRNDCPPAEKSYDRSHCSAHCSSKVADAPYTS